MDKAVTTPRKPGRPTAEDSGDTRERILDTTHALLIESAGRSVSLNTIGERAEVNKAMVSYYFGSKHNLLVALFERLSNGWAERLDRLIRHDATPREKLRLHVREIIRNYCRFPYINRLMTELVMTSDEETARRLSASYVLPLTGFYRHLLAQGLETGDFRPLHERDLFFTVVGTAEFIFGSKSMLEPSFGIASITQEHEEEFTDRIVNLVLFGLVARPD